MKRKMILIVLFLAVMGFFPGCEKKGPAERAGEQIDKGVDKIQETVKDAGKDIKKHVNE